MERRKAKSRQKWMLDQILYVMRIYTPQRIYIHCGHSSTQVQCVVLHQSQDIICAHRVFPHSFQWGLDYHGFKTSSFLIEFTCRLLTCSLGKVSSFPFSFHSCPFWLPAQCLFPRLGMSLCRRRAAWDTSAECDWNLLDSERTFMDISHSSHNQWND